MLKGWLAGPQGAVHHQGKRMAGVTQPLLGQVGVSPDGCVDNMESCPFSSQHTHPTYLASVLCVSILLLCLCLLAAPSSSTYLQVVTCAPSNPTPDPLQVCMQQEAHPAELLADAQVQGWHFEQHEGEVVFIPAGCPHQVRNLRPCTKVRQRSGSGDS